MTVKTEYYYKLNEKKEKVYYVNKGGEIRIVGINGTAFEMKKWLVNNQKLSYSKASKEVEQIRLYKEPKKEKGNKNVI